MLAALPTIKLPDQNKVVRTSNIYAKLLFFGTNYENLIEL